MANDPNTIQYVIQEDGFWYVASKDRTPGVPGITVSSKGIANGLSTEYNDGCDFGPDSYNPNYSGSGIPYTQTSGLYEATQYGLTNGVRVLVKNGHYIIDANAPFYKVGTINYDGENTADFYALIPLNTNNTAGTLNAIHIEGETLALPSIGGQSNSSNTIVPFNWGGVTIDLTNVSLPSTSSIYVVFGAQQSGRPTNPAIIRGITVMAPTPIQFGHTIVSAATSSSVEYCSLMPVPGEQSFLSGTASDNPLNVAFHISGQDGNMGWANMLYVQQAYKAYILTAHTTCGTMGAQSCIQGLLPISGYAPTVLHYDVQGTKYPVYINSNGTGNATLIIVQWQEEDYVNATGINPDFQTVYDVYSEYNGSPSLSLELHVLNAVMNRNGSTNLTNPKVSGGLFVKFDRLQYIGQATLPATLTTNPPASATVYQNTNPYDILIYLPSYATSSGTAGSVAVAIGSTSSPSTTFTQFVSGSTSSSSPDTLQIKVPAGWYYEVTTTSVTLATATVVAD